MISYEILKPKDAAEAARLINDVFLNHEPMSICNNPDPQKHLVLISHLVTYTAEAGLTVAARDEETGKLVGALTHRDYTLVPSPGLPEEYIPYLNMFNAEMAICHELEEPLIKKDYSKGELFQPFQLAVLPGYSGKGIASGLAAQSVQLGKKLGFSAAAVECSVMGSRRAFEKNGYRLINSVSFKDFVYNDAKFYGSIDGSFYLLYRDL